MEKRSGKTEKSESTSKSPRKKLTEYGKQLAEKQKVKHMYGLRERQFKRFFTMAIRNEGAPGENLLSLLERRLDNTVYRLKMTKSRAQARQIIVHGHIRVNNKKVSSPSFLVSPHDEISLNPRDDEKKAFLENVVEKRMKIAIKVPEWLELDKKKREGRVLRDPARSDIQVPIEEHLIVELYSK
ncbi:MAG: 30S ribosomal protein S4 [Candidatus Babeliales bacterium]|jgi:small subunit ribosomal protein S4